MLDKRTDIIGITMGCPVGIGPEIILKFFGRSNNYIGFWPVVIGDLGVLKRCAAELDVAVPLKEWEPGQPVDRKGINVCSVERYTDKDISFVANELHWGVPSQKTGLAMAAYVEQAFQLIENGVLAGMVTCPITKSALHAAGYSYPGHTEMLASLCETERYAMMMAGDTLKVTLVTIHQRLTEVSGSLTVDGIVRLIQLTAKSLQNDFAVPNPSIAVAGLNPHAGEGGMFGDEESVIIAPAVAHAVSLGLSVVGPLPPDTVFNQAVSGRYDAVVCMYHDQGLIPFKLLHFADGVNVTIGLPIVRTSVDHGTAYDIAGKGVAADDSLQAAVLMASEIIRSRVGSELNG